MNYRHGFHAGNAGDVLKHAVLAWTIERLKAKPAPFAVLDTHAGIGRYNLDAPEARSTGEWQAGAGRLWEERPQGALGELLAPWYGVLDALNPDGVLARYPGSPELALRLLRAGDRATFVERHPEDAVLLDRRYGREKRARVLAADGWAAVDAELPPRERRGLVLVDPAFEARDDFVRLDDALARMHRRWATGLFLGWYPIKGAEAADRLARAVRARAIPKTARVELTWRLPNHPRRFDGAGLIVLNPPFGLLPLLERALPALAARLAAGEGAAARVEVLTPERPA